MRSIHPYLIRKKHVIWDWNGTLLCDVDHAVQITNKLLLEENLPPTTVKNYKEIFSFPVIDYYRRLGFDALRLSRATAARCGRRSSLRFADRGGMIQFVLDGNRVRFEINLNAAQHSGLSLSSQLLKVAVAVRREP